MPGVAQCGLPLGGKRRNEQRRTPAQVGCGHGGSVQRSTAVNVQPPSLRGAAGPQGGKPRCAGKPVGEQAVINLALPRCRQQYGGGQRGSVGRKGGPGIGGSWRDTHFRIEGSGAAGLRASRTQSPARVMDTPVSAKKRRKAP